MGQLDQLGGIRRTDERSNKTVKDKRAVTSDSASESARSDRAKRGKHLHEKGKAGNLEQAEGPRKVFPAE